MDTREKYDRYVMTSFTAGIEPVVVASAEGARVVDADGRSYIDCFAGISVVNAGHGAPDVRQAAKEQIDRLIHCSSYTYYAQPVANLAERLAEVTPGRLQKTFFANSGAEGIESLAPPTRGSAKLSALKDRSTRRRFESRRRAPACGGAEQGIYALSAPCDGLSGPRLSTRSTKEIHHHGDRQ